MHKVTRLLIIGNGGHARSIADVALKNDISHYLFLDTRLTTNIENMEPNTHFIVGIGNNELRCQQFQNFCQHITPISIIAHSVWVGHATQIGLGTFVGNRAHIGPFSSIGDNCIINTGATIEHDVNIGSHTHIAVNSTICGNTKIGNFCFIGTGATIIDNINICNNVTIGAGAVVVSNIIESGTYVGIPARKIVS